MDGQEEYSEPQIMDDHCKDCNEGVFSQNSFKMEEDYIDFFIRHEIIKTPYCGTCSKNAKLFKKKSLLPGDAKVYLIIMMELKLGVISLNQSTKIQDQKM